MTTMVNPVRQSPWVALGTQTNNLLTAEQALVEAGLDWTVEKRDLFTLGNDGLFAEVPDKKATVIAESGQVLGVVGKTYEPIQNDRILTWAESLIATDKAAFTSAGALRGGRLVFASLVLDKPVDLPGDDRIDPYLVVASSHDGTQAFRAVTSPLRVVCTNTLVLALRSAKSSWTIRHTVSADFRLQAARELLGLTFGYYDALSMEAFKLADQRVFDREFERIVDQLIPMPKDASPRVASNVSERRAQLRAVYDGPTIEHFRGTGWGVLNAVNEYELWHTRVQGHRLERQAVRNFNGEFPFTERARQLLAAVA